MKQLGFAILVSLPLLAQTAEVSRHFFDSAAALTPPSSQAPRDAARDYLASVAAEFGVPAEDLVSVYVAKEYHTAHNGVTHIVFRQQFDGADVANAEFTVNVAPDGSVVNAGGKLVRKPAAGLTAPEPASALAAVRRAVREVNPEAGARYAPFQSGSRGNRRLVFSRGEFGGDVEGQPVWFERNGVLAPAWKFEITDTDRVHTWNITVDGRGRRVLAKDSLTFHQSAPRGLVFDKGNPQPNPKPGVLLTAPPPLVPRVLMPFTGDPLSSPRGWVSGRETAGNNVVAGTNPLGVECLAATTCLVHPVTAVAANGDFSFPLETGDGARPVTAFPDAATTNLFYWSNRAHDWFYQLGFDEAAGNFQADNYGKPGVPGDAIFAYSQFGVAYPGQPQIATTHYSTFRADDGAQSHLAMSLELDPNGLPYDDDLDAETVVHEYAHGVSTRLVRQLSSSYHGEAMGEGWSDFLALEMLLPEGTPLDGAYPFSEYPNQTFGAGIRTRPYSTSMEVNPLTFAQFARINNGPEVHDDGEIWAEALWEMRANLIKQFGEREGRRRVRLLVVDGMKLSPPAPSMIDMRDAILLADRTDFQGASQDQIWAGFAKRGLGALAQSYSGNSAHVTASFDIPSTQGAMKFYDDPFVIGEPVRIVLQDSNLKSATVRIQLTGSSGDLENLVLRRKGDIYTATILSSYGPVARTDNDLQLIPGDFISAYYVDENTGSGSKLIEATVATTPDYASSTRTGIPYDFARETALGLHGITYRPVSIGFPFPFYGQNYSMVWVDQTGLLSFEAPLFVGCTSANWLAYMKAIAPLWMFLNTEGSAQPKEDVYVSRGQDSATFRWVAETAPDFGGNNPEPVNFAATLFRDGRIQFQYGDGNKNLVGGSQVFGCSVSAPTVGISNGHESYAQLVPTHDSKGMLEKARTVTLDPPYGFSSIPFGRLDTPAADDVAKGVLAGTGIAYDPNPDTPLRRVDLLIDGIAQDNPTLGVSRPDYCTDNTAPGCPRVGFDFKEPLQLIGIDPGRHTLQLQATNTRGAFFRFPETPLPFTVEPGEGGAPAGRIEAPAPGDEVSGRVTVKGWAASDIYHVSMVEVLVDGVNFGRAQYGATRSDVCAGLQSPDCPRVGFAFTLDTQDGPVAIANGRHTLQLRVMDESVRMTLVPENPIEITVNNEAAAMPTAVLATPKPNDKLTGTIKVSGYAWVPGGKITRVRLVVDQIAFATLPYGLPRAEECASLPDVAACPNIGFEGDFDTRLLSNGPHTLYVIVQDDNGSTVNVPAAGFFGMNVTVEN